MDLDRFEPRELISAENGGLSRLPVTIRVIRNVALTAQSGVDAAQTSWTLYTPPPSDDATHRLGGWR